MTAMPSAYDEVLRYLEQIRGYLEKIETSVSRLSPPERGTNDRPTQ